MSFFDRQPHPIWLRAGRKGNVRILSISRPIYKRLCVEHSYIPVNLLEFVVMSLDKLIRNSSKDIEAMYKHGYWHSLLLKLINLLDKVFFFFLINFSL